MIQQNINEFNKLASNIKFLSYSDGIVLSSKLKCISAQFENLNYQMGSSSEFFSNLYQLLCQSDDLKADLLDNCLDILQKSASSSCSKIRETLLKDFRFLPVLVSVLISSAREDNDHTLIKLLSVIRELLIYSTELDEHNLKLIIEALRDHTENHQNHEVLKICFHILANLCLENKAAKYLITRIVKSMEFKSKIESLQDDLISFKFLILLEDEIYSNDVKYFVEMSLRDIRASIANFNLDSIRHSLDLLKHFEKLEIKLDFKLNAEEKVTTLLSNVIKDLIEVLPGTGESSPKDNFFEAVFQYFSGLLHLDTDLSNEFESFTDNAFLSGKISRSTSALKFLTDYIKFTGSLKKSEIIVESLLEHFTGDESSQKEIDYKQVRNLLIIHLLIIHLLLIHFRNTRF